MTLHPSIPARILALCALVLTAAPFMGTPSVCAQVGGSESLFSRLGPIGSASVQDLVVFPNLPGISTNSIRTVNSPNALETVLDIASGIPDPAVPLVQTPLIVEPSIFIDTIDLAATGPDPLLRIGETGQITIGTNFANSIPLGYTPTDYETVDLDGNGLEDLVVVGLSGSFHVLFDGALPVLTYGLPTSEPILRVQSGDIDGDGFADLGFLDDNGNRYELNGAGNGFFLMTTILSAALTDDIVWADLDDDGITDRFRLNNSFLFGDLSTGFSISANFSSFGPNLNRDRIVFEDLDLDGVQDIIVLGDDALFAAYFEATNSTFGTFGTVPGLPDLDLSDQPYNRILQAEVTNDGMLDLIVWASGANAYEVIARVSPGDQEFGRGDLDGDGSVSIADAISLLTLLSGTGAGSLCPDAGDVDDNSRIQLADVIALLSRIVGISAGPFPAPDFDECGIDPTPDGLPCFVPSSSCP